MERLELVRRKGGRRIENQGQILVLDVNEMMRMTILIVKVVLVLQMKKGVDPRGRSLPLNIRGRKR